MSSHNRAVSAHNANKDGLTGTGAETPAEPFSDINNPSDDNASGHLNEPNNNEYASDGADSTISAHSEKSSTSGRNSVASSSQPSTKFDFNYDVTPTIRTAKWLHPEDPNRLNMFQTIVLNNLAVLAERTDNLERLTIANSGPQRVKKIKSNARSSKAADANTPSVSNVAKEQSGQAGQGNSAHTQPTSQ